jgi:hypothetical protein
MMIAPALEPPAAVNIEFTPKTALTRSDYYPAIAC